VYRALGHGSDDLSYSVLSADLEEITIRHHLDIAGAAGASLEFLGRIALGRLLVAADVRAGAHG
jgi:hypothetical protein